MFQFQEKKIYSEVEIATLLTVTAIPPSSTPVFPPTSTTSTNNTVNSNSLNSNSNNQINGTLINFLSRKKHVFESEKKFYGLVANQVSRSVELINPVLE